VRRLFAAVAVAALATLCGCANIVYRTDSEPNRGPYFCTCEMAATVAAPFTAPNGPEGSIGKAVCTVILPVTLVSLPCDAVLDTLFLPYDLWAYDGDRGLGRGKCHEGDR